MLFVFFTNFCNAQSISRYVIGASGATISNQQVTCDWTIGEVIIETGTNLKYSLTQGFHQPDAIVKLNPIDFSIPEGFSPNGDGINDLFVIRGISNYPNNSIQIFNRWGDEVYHISPYNNQWDGQTQSGYTVGGTQLPIGTYFYLFNCGNGSPVIKGTIYLNR